MGARPQRCKVIYLGRGYVRGVRIAAMETATITWRIVKMTDAEKEERRKAKRRVYLPLTGGICHYEIAGTGRIVRARKNCKHLNAPASEPSE